MIYLSDPTLAALKNLLRERQQMISHYQLDRTKLHPLINAPRQPTDAERAALKARHATILEALIYMRDTTNSTAQHARAVSALKAMGVGHE